jgi:hypothetical protein
MFDPGWDSGFATCQDKVGWFRTESVDKAEPKPRVFVPVKKVNPRLRLEELRKARITAHPDKGGSSEEFIEINREYEMLKKLLV